MIFAAEKSMDMRIRTHVSWLILVSVILVSGGAAGCGGAAPPPTTQVSEERPVRRERARREVNAPTGDGSVRITDLKVGENGTFEIVLNGVLRIPGVRIVDGAKGKFLSFPQREKDGDFFPYISVDSASVAPGLLATVQAGRVPEEAQDVSVRGFEITEVEVHPLEGDGKSKAFVTIFLNGGKVRLYSWKLIEGRDGLWLAAPSERVEEEWVEVIETVDQDFKKALENKAIQAFEG